MLKCFLVSKENNIQKDTQIWNVVFSVLNAVQSALLLFIITRLCGRTDAGIFSLAFSVSYLMIMIGNYGVRNFHSTDVIGSYSPKAYYLHRGICCFLMLLSSYIYILCHPYEMEKRVIIILCCILKMFESIEDVIHGEYQRCGRLDIASKIGTIRYLFSMIAFIITIIISRSLFFSFITMDIVSILVLVWLAKQTYTDAVCIKQVGTRKWYYIFVECVPVFLSTFFNIYICNASKYAIDKYYDDSIQGVYGMIFMPVFVINLLCICIYRPKLVELAELWNEKKVAELRGFFAKQLFVTVIISSLIIVVGYFIGTQFLTLFYGISLIDYRIEFIVLLIGGAMTAIVDFCGNMMIVSRKQKFIVWIYGGIFILVFFTTGFMVKNYMLLGASFAFCGAMTIQAIIMIICFLYILSKAKK